MKEIHPILEFETIHESLLWLSMCTKRTASEESPHFLCVGNLESTMTGVRQQTPIWRRTIGLVERAPGWGKYFTFVSRSMCMHETNSLRCRYVNSCGASASFWWHPVPVVCWGISIRPTDISNQIRPLLQRSCQNSPLHQIGWNDKHYKM